MMGGKLYLLVFSIVLPYSIQAWSFPEKSSTGEFSKANIDSRWIKKRKGFFYDDGVLCVGVSAGQETFIGLPKIALYKHIPLTQKWNKNKFGYKPLSIYFGPEASIFGFYALILSVSGSAGISLGPVTIDNSLTYSAMFEPSGERYDYPSYNPKVGLRIGPVWLKAGRFVEFNPIRKGVDEWLKYEGIKYNFELLYIFHSKK